ncbi:hypothetical protein [Bacillus sp. FJAT-27245]|uniref:hypothetical protein n=1 Tax=Bacillus sp. FJAT-27245 TaxID=1684144 RepID=UPI0006A7D936|nr:hypothetical protein [Bacillus sp. FJAT-27245]
MSKNSYWNLLTPREKDLIEIYEKKLENATSIEEVERYKIQIGIIMVQIIKRAKTVQKGKNLKSNNTKKDLVPS